MQRTMEERGANHYPLDAFGWQIYRAVKSWEAVCHNEVTPKLPKSGECPASCPTIIIDICHNSIVSNHWLIIA